MFSLAGLQDKGSLQCGNLKSLRFGGLPYLTKMFIYKERQAITKKTPMLVRYVLRFAFDWL